LESGAGDADEAARNGNRERRAAASISGALSYFGRGSDGSGSRRHDGRPVGLSYLPTDSFAMPSTCEAIPHGASDGERAGREKRMTSARESAKTPPII